MRRALSCLRPLVLTAVATSRMVRRMRATACTSLLDAPGWQPSAASMQPQPAAGVSTRPLEAVVARNSDDHNPRRPTPPRHRSVTFTSLPKSAMRRSLLLSRATYLLSCSCLLSVSWQGTVCPTCLWRVWSRIASEGRRYPALRSLTALARQTTVAPIVTPARMEADLRLRRNWH